jgi:hypothetical protein
MRLFTAARRHALVIAGCAAAFAVIGEARASLYDAPDKVSKPSVSLKATPQVGFAPIRMVFTAEIKGDDHSDLYCPAIEWNWGDETRSLKQADCEPFEPGKSEIKRRYVIDHTFEGPGAWKVEFRLKQKDKVVAYGSTTVQVRPGIRDGGLNSPQTGECEAEQPLRRPPC